MASKFFIPTTRIEAFSDGVFAIVMTLLAFQFKVPEFSSNAGLGGNFQELMEVSTNFFSFVFSFLFVAVFWINHHQLFHSIKEADRKLLWLNIHLLFWIIMIPFPTGMVGDYPKVPLAAMSLAFVLLMVSVSSYLVRRYSYNQSFSTKENASARSIKEGFLQNIIAIVLNLAAIATTFISVNITYVIFLAVLILFSIPHSSEIKKRIIIKKLKHEKRNATAVWNGTGKEGKGVLSTQSKTLDNTQYSYLSRFESGVGTNPEELVAAAHAGCFSMKLAFVLNVAGFTADKIETKCDITLEDGTITESHLNVKATIPGISPEQFTTAVEDAKANCPISKLYKTNISHEAILG